MQTSLVQTSTLLTSKNMCNHNLQLQLFSLQFSVHEQCRKLRLLFYTKCTNYTSHPAAHNKTIYYNWTHIIASWFCQIFTATCTTFITKINFHTFKWQHSTVFIQLLCTLTSSYKISHQQFDQFQHGHYSLHYSPFLGVNATVKLHKYDFNKSIINPQFPHHIQSVYRNSVNNLQYGKSTALKSTHNLTLIAKFCSATWWYSWDYHRPNEKQQ